jgi:ABC-2 type transport system ATP-binding protein
MGTTFGEQKSDLFAISLQKLHVPFHLLDPLGKPLHAAVQMKIKILQFFPSHLAKVPFHEKSAAQLHAIDLLLSIRIREGSALTDSRPGETQVFVELIHDRLVIITFYFAPIPTKSFSFEPFLEKMFVHRSFWRRIEMKILADGLQFQTGLNGVLGPRGVGKTRLLKHLSEQSRGEASDVCYVSRELEAFHRLTVKEYLGVMAGPAAKRGAERIEHALQQVHLTKMADCNVGEISNLAKSQTLIARSLLCDAHLLLLDDILSGLSDQEKMNIGFSLSEIAKERAIVLACGLEEALEGLYDSVIFLHQAKEAVQVPTNTAYSWVEGKVWEYITPELPRAEGCLITASKQCGDAVYVREVAVEVPDEEVSQVTPTLADAYVWWATDQFQEEMGKQKGSL